MGPAPHTRQAEARPRPAEVAGLRRARDDQLVFLIESFRGAAGRRSVPPASRQLLLQADWAESVF